MKSLKKLILLPACAAALIASVGTGCNDKSYTVYTNIPQGEYEIVDSTFKLGEKISGYSPVDKGEAEPVDTSNYTAKGRTFPSVMYTEAQLVVYDDFGADANENSFDKFTTEAGKKFARFSSEVKSTLDGISKAVSSTVTGSDIYNFNNAAAGETVEISKTTYEILSEAKAAYEFTEGYYNPALYYNVLAYGFGSAADYPESAAQLPADETIAKYTELAAHFNEIEVYTSGETYKAIKPDFTVEVGGETLSLKLDLGGIAKGYAVDIIDSAFEEYGYKFGYFNFGASSMSVKRHFQSENFKIQFGSPRSLTRDGYFKIELKNDKLSTSGDNEQFYNIDGKRYCHIIDPTTGKPVQTGIMSVTVVGGSAAQDDAITTAIMAMGKDKAISFIEEKLTDRRVVFTCE